MSAPEEPRGLRERVAEIGKRWDITNPEFAEAILALLVGDEEPVAYRVRNSPTSRRWVYHENQYKPGVMARILDDITPEGSEIVPLYTRPAPTQEVERLREALEGIARSAPPDDWEYDYHPMCGYDYLGYDEVPRSDPAWVGDVDGGNAGDVHAHGQAVGRWSAAKLARRALNEGRQADTEENDG